MNTSTILSGTGLAVPNDFPAREFEAVYQKLHAHRQRKREYALAIGAMHAMSYRFMALAEYGDRFTASIKASGAGPSPPIRYEQERDLFGFFSSAFSVFETFWFALFVIGALTGSRNALTGKSNFPLATAQDEQKVRWRKMTSQYQISFKGDPILTIIKAIHADPSYSQISDSRNVLTHRATPPRHHTFPAGSPTPTETAIPDINVVVDATTTSSRRQDVARLLQLGLHAAEKFVAARL